MTKEPNPPETPDDGEVLPDDADDTVPQSDPAPEDDDGAPS